MPVAEGLGGERGTHHQRRTAADDTVGAEHPLVEIGDVYRAALAATEAALLAEQLLHHAADVAALGDRMAVPAMRAGDVVLGSKVLADADRRGFLAGVEMDKAGDAALGEFLLKPRLEPRDR